MCAVQQQLPESFQPLALLDVPNQGQQKSLKKSGWQTVEEPATMLVIVIQQVPIHLINVGFFNILSIFFIASINRKQILAQSPVPISPLAHLLVFV
jgi:hypothetical protein